MLKIKSLKEIIEPIANERGIPFEEYLEFISDKDRFELIYNQLEKKSKHKNLGSESKIERYLSSDEDFVKYCKEYFKVSLDENMLSRYRDLTIKVINNMLSYNYTHHYTSRYIDPNPKLENDWSREDRERYKKIYGRIKELNMFHDFNIFEISNSVEDELIEFARSIFGDEYKYEHNPLNGRIDRYILDRIMHKYIYTDVNRRNASHILSMAIPHKDLLKNGIFKESDLSIDTKNRIAWAIKESNCHPYNHPVAFHETYIADKETKNIEQFKERVFEYIEFLESKVEICSKLKDL